MSTSLGYLSDYQVGLWMADLVAGESWASLHSSDPGVVQDSPSATELQGASYVRSRVFWKVAGARVLVSTSPSEWRGLAQAVVTHLGVFDHQFAGHLRAIIPRLVPVYVMDNGSFRLDAGELYIRWP